MQYFLKLDYICADNNKNLFFQRKNNIKTTQMFWYASGLDLNYAEYYIKKSPILIYLN